ncbi:unnamed protein product [Parnassius mnemosyne]|uniref:Uncharacterized protein n=1 Tax=Parnassius mnemosyne TaxID=213953 RepID=A0AAV1K8E5_9NEOP
MLNTCSTSNAITREKRSPQGPPHKMNGRGPPGHQPGGPPGHQPGGPPGHQPGGPPGHQPGGPPGHQKQKGKKPGKGNPHRDYYDEDTLSQEVDTDFNYNLNYNRPTSNMGTIYKGPQDFMQQNIYKTEDQMKGNTNLLNSNNKIDTSTKNNEKITYDAGQAFVLVNGNTNKDKNVVPVTLVFQAQPVTPAS